MRQWVFFLLLGTFFTAQSQYTLTGLKGMINVPKADVLEEKSLLLGVHTNHEDYLLIDYENNRPEGNEYINIVSVGFYKRLSITMMLSRIFGDPKQTVGEKTSIGDRSLQLTYLLLKENTRLPSVVINITDPLFSTNQYLAGNHLVASKNFLLADKHRFTGTLGYGLPYLLTFARQEQRELVSKQSDFLTGFFGGVQYHHLPTDLYGSLEYDGWNVNAGVGIVCWDQLSLQVYVQNMKRVGVGLNFSGVVR